MQSCQKLLNIEFLKHFLFRIQDLIKEKEENQLKISTLLDSVKEKDRQKLQIL